MRSYESKPKAEPYFELDRVRFTPAAMSLLDLAELGKFAALDVTSAGGLAAMAGFFAQILGPDYDRFKTHCAERRTDPETLLQIVEDVLGDVLGFPTQPLSGSSDGPESTVPTLRVVSSDGKTVTEEPLTPERVAELRAAAAG